MIAQRFDIAIIGAGLAGSALAAALGGSQWRIALIEAQPLSLQWPALSDDIDGFDLRVSALTAASKSWLEQLGAWHDIATRRVSPYRHMHVWDGDGTGAIHFDAGDVNRAELGHIVENNLLQTALLHRVTTHRNVQIFSGSAVEQFLHDENGIAITLQNNTQSHATKLHATLLVGADGANSRLREWAQFRMREWEYGHTAIVATIQTDRPHAQTARQVFRREGPLAFLPLKTAALPTAQGDEHFSSIVWSTQPEEAQALMAMSDAQFMQALGRAFEFTLGEIKGTSRRVAFPLRARHAQDYVQAHIALIGDAAHTIHPLAGQGINLGFLDAQALARELLRAEQRGLSVAATDVLARYQRERKSDNVATLAAMDGFKRLFGADALAVRLLRNVGLKWIDRSGPLKRLLIRQAMGIAP